MGEGTANYGVHVDFPPAERQPLHRDGIFPPRGLNPAGDEEYYELTALLEQMNVGGANSLVVPSEYLEAVVTPRAGR